MKKNLKIILKNFAKQKKTINITAYEYNPEIAYKILKAEDYSTFDQSVDLCIKLGINVKRSEHNVRGSCVLPGGIGKTKKICFFGEGEDQKKRGRDSGADIIGGEDTLEKFDKGVIDFDVLYSTVEALPILKPYARFLGPKGLFPNIKVQTLVKDSDIENTIKNAKGGKIDFKNDNCGDVKVMIGKLSFGYDKIQGNIKTLMEYINEKKPNNFKGTFFKKIVLSSTLGKGYELHPPFLDPMSKKYILN